MTKDTEALLKELEDLCGTFRYAVGQFLREHTIRSVLEQKLDHAEEMMIRIRKKDLEWEDGCG